MLNFNSLLLFSEKPEALAAFYKQVFTTKPVWEGDGYTTFAVGQGYITVGPHSEVKGKSKEPARIMFNLETKEVKEEFERIKKIGAHVIKEPNDEDEMGQIATFADPDGNYFQLMPPMPMDQTSD
jgi:predicted enzyme related to lactoylglutathione lyase